MPRALRDLSPFRLIIGNEDCTFLLDDGGTFANVDPGGFETAAFSIPKDMPQTIRGQYVRLDSGLGVAWEGRVSQLQRSLGNRTQITCEGFGAVLKDTAGSMVFVDRDLTHYQPPGAPRQISLSPTDTLGEFQVAADPTTNSPALAEGATGPWAGSAGFSAEAYYDAGPQNVAAKIYYDVTPNANIAVADTNWRWAVWSTPDQSSFPENSGQLRSAHAFGYFTPGTARRFFMVQTNYTVAAGNAVDYLTFWHNLAVYGNHGLTGRGADPVGFYPSDIFSWVINQIPGINLGVIQQTDASNYIVPHSAYYTPVTLDTIVGDMATAQGWHWGVWESICPLTGNATPRADFRPRPAPGAFTISCRREDCSTLDIREDLANQYNQAAVTWTNVDGTQGSVTVAVDNPILDEAGIASRTVVFTAGTMTPATAAVFGAEALALLNAQARIAGTAAIISAIDGGARPAWMLRAGIDRLRIPDMPSTDAFGIYNDYPISRVETSISSGGITTNVELGTGAQLVETLQARLAAVTALAGQGGA